MRHACEQTSRLVSESLERKLSMHERLRMRLHLLMCTACNHYSDNQKKLHLLFSSERKRKKSDISLPQDRRSEIEQVLKNVSPKR